MEGINCHGICFSFAFSLNSTRLSQGGRAKSVISCFRFVTYQLLHGVICRQPRNLSDTGRLPLATEKSLRPVQHQGTAGRQSNVLRHSERHSIGETELKLHQLINQKTSSQYVFRIRFSIRRMALPKVIACSSGSAATRRKKQNIVSWTLIGGWTRARLPSR